MLANEGVNDKELFYEVFGLSVKSNAKSEKYTYGAKSCYNADILYGSIGEFQFDYLRDTFRKIEN